MFRQRLHGLFGEVRKLQNDAANRPKTFRQNRLRAVTIQRFSVSLS
jgi:hypothetical protein